MLVPESADPRLAELIDAHTRFGLLPDAHVLAYFEIAEAMATLLSDEGAATGRVLAIGARSFPLLDAGVQPQVFHAYEPRAQYRECCRALHPGVELLSEDGLESALAETDVVLLHADAIAQGGWRNPLLADINRHVDKRQRFLLLRYRWEDFSTLTQLDGNGLVNNNKQYRAWFERNRSHMHLGFETRDYGVLKASDLSYFY